MRITGWGLSICLVCVGCGGDDSEDGGDSVSCIAPPCLGVLEMTAGSSSSTCDVRELLGDPAADFAMLTLACSGSVKASIDGVPSPVGTYSFTEPTQTAGTLLFGPNMALNVSGMDFMIGFDNLFGCAPCGSGSVTVTESNAVRIAGTLEGTAWRVQNVPGGWAPDASSTLPVTASFSARWP